MADLEAKQSGPDIVRSLYKSLSACADHHDPALIRRLHIPTAIDDAIVMAARQNKVVIVTGNTGDGKTHLIRQIEDEFAFGVTINKDANEVEDETLVKAIDKAVTLGEALILAINEGILLDICEQSKSRCPWAAPIIDAILRPYVYDDCGTKELGSIRILDLNLRNNLSGEVVGHAIDRIADLAVDGADPSGPLNANLQRLRHPVVRERVTHLLETVGRTGFHATMRELLGFVAYLLCGGEDRAANAPPRPYYLNAFVGGQGPLFDRLRQFDPLLMPMPFLDDRLFMVQDTDAEWEINPPDEMRTAEDMNLFRERKRRAYFEHRSGREILRTDRTDAERYFTQLTRREQSPEQVAIRLLNRFFDSRDQKTDELTLWVAHQYNARPTRFVASRQIVSAAEFTVAMPALPTDLRDVFRDHHPDHVILRHRDMSPGDGLVIDRRLVGMLVAGDRMSGLGTRNPDAQTKIAAFYDKLARICTNQQNVVQVLRLDNMSKCRIGVNVATGEYYIPGGGS